MEHIVAVGFSDDGRLSLAGCWVMGEQLIAEAVEAGTAPDWVNEAHPLVVPYMGPRRARRSCRCRSRR